MTTLTAEQRTSLERLVRRARAVLETDLSSQLSGRFGIDPDGRLEDEEELHLDPTTQSARRDIVDVIEHLHTEGEDAAGAVARLLRESVFTHLNRLMAIRIAESLGLLAPSLAEGRRSRGYLDVLELAPPLAGEPTGGYWMYLQLCGDELASDVPTLFDPRNPLLAMAPSPSAIDELVDQLADPASANLWEADDCLGWTYQFFNSSEERRAMREASASPRNSRELAVRNQFFTPRYVVDFLVQNSLGRRLLDADPHSPLLADLPLLIDPPTEPSEPLDLSDVSVLDPACGSGHFLLAAYDVLELAWGYAGVEPSEAAPRVVSSLWGIDIDPRCVQVAGAAIVLRARKSCPDGSLPRPNIVCARSLPLAATGMNQLLAALPRAQELLVQRASETLAEAPILGPLLRIEELLSTEVRAAAFGGSAPPGSLAEAIPEDTLVSLRTELLTTLADLANATKASPAERLLAAEADDAIRFIEALERRYDAVLMNPPFGEPVPASKPYLRAAYRWLPSRTSDLLAAFVGRGTELCKTGGYVGAITSRAGMFLKTFEGWREEILLGHRLVALADLGHGVMEQALVEAAAYVIAAGKEEPGDHGTFVRLLSEVDRPAGLVAAIAASRTGEKDHRVFTVPLEDLRAIPGSPLAYWMSPSVRRLFADYPSLEGNGADVRQGLATGDDFRFVRAIWEVDPASVARNRDETRHRRWVPFAKGGEYSPFWADVHLVVHFESDGDALRAFEGSVIRNAQYYFRAGLSWPLRTASGFGPRILPAGSAFGHKGPSVFAPVESLAALQGWLQSRLVAAALGGMIAAGDTVTSGGIAKSYEVGLVQKVPWPGLSIDLSPVGDLTVQIAELRRLSDLEDETTRSFVVPALLQDRDVGGLRASALVATSRAEQASLTALRLTAEVEHLLTDALDIDSEGEAYLNAEVGPHPESYPPGELDEERFATSFQAPIGSIIEETIAREGGSRAVANLTYFADRRLEVLAHAFERPPSQLAEVRKRLGLLPPEQPRDAVEQLVSYLVGAAFGRWDIRVALDPTTAPALGELFEPVPVRPPGMLVDADGAQAAEAPEGYPIAVPPRRLLVDQPGHSWDIEARVLAAASAIFGDPETMVAEALAIIGQRSLRGYLRRGFFSSHLSRYSKSRRKAPIYLPLYTPSGRWGAWAYAPSLSREMLYAVVRAAADRLDNAEAEMRRLHSERETGGAGRSAREVASALEEEERLARELQQFKVEAERISGLGWEPDLDDGILLCAAPLADLMPGWQDAASARSDLKAGQYPWATVSDHAEQL